MVVEVLHPGVSGVSRKKVMELLGKMYKADPKQVICFGFKTAFGGGRSTGFALIYDSLEVVKKFEHKYRQARAGIITLPTTKTGRKMRKEKKNRAKKVRGKEKNKPQTKAK
jgi:small subunit ribosomal protein S24e